MPRRILVISHDRTFRAGIKRAMAGLSGGWIMQEAGSGEEAITLLGSGFPDAILLDADALENAQMVADWAAREAPKLKVALASDGKWSTQLRKPVGTAALRGWLGL